jgi:D-xylulose reductase
VFEASGSPKAYDGIFDLVRPGGCLVLIDMPTDPVAFDVVTAGVKEAQIETVFRCANIHARAIELIAQAKLI